MNVFMLRVLQLAPAVALIGALALPDETARKCGVQPERNMPPLLAINGVIMPMGTDSLVQQAGGEKNIYAIAIVCMNPQDSTFNRGHGIPVISVWTLDGPAPRLKEALTLIRDAQDAHFRRAGKYAANLEDIRLPDAMSRVRVTLQAHEKGWTARATVDRLLETCSLYDGDVAPPRYPYDPPRQILCVND